MDVSSQPTTPLAVAIVAEALAALVGAALLGLVFAYGGGWLIGLTPWGGQLGMGLLTLMVYLGLLGAGVGAAAGIAFAGRALRQGGSFWLSLAAGLVGAIVLAMLAFTGMLGRNFFGAVWIIVFGTLVMAMLGYNMRRVR